MRQLYCTLLILCTFHATVLAQTGEKTEGGATFKTEVDGIGTSAATFLEIGVGGRALGMGAAYVSVANDASALYWNPAGIVWANRVEIEAMHNEWFLDASFQFLGAIVPLSEGRSALGLSFSTLGFGEQKVRTVSRPEGTGEFYDARDLALGVTYAMALTDRFSFGITAKYIHSRIWTMNGNAFAADLGIFYNTQLDGLRLGFSMSNFGTDLQFGGRSLDTSVDPDPEVENFDRVPSQIKTNAFSLPLLFRVGVSYQTNLGELGSSLLSVDLNHPSNAPESVNMGVELAMMNLCFLRAGYNSLFDATAQNGLTLGAGLDYREESAGLGLRFDYSWADWGVLGSNQTFSLGVVF